MLTVPASARMEKLREGIYAIVQRARAGRFLGDFLWNMVGTATPLLAAVVSIPFLYAAIGIDRFGILSLAWVIVGYFSLFDLGLGRALTQLIAQKLGTEQEGEIPSLAKAGMLAMGGLGLIGAVTAAALSPWLAQGVLKIPVSLQRETMIALFWLSTSIPLVIITTGLRGILEAHRRFDLVNWIRAPLGLFTYLGPLAVLPFSVHLPELVGALVAARLVSFVAYLVICLRLYPDFRGAQYPSREAWIQLLSFGGWMTVSNIVGPLLLYLGRLVLAVAVSAQAVAWFSTPYDMVINCLLITTAIVTVAFPTFSRAFANDVPAVRVAYRNACWFNAALLLPPALLVLFLAHPVLAWWLDADFAHNSYRAAQILAVGIFVNSFGHISQALIQASGRPDITAKLHVFELVLYLPYLWWLVSAYGVNGAAYAWLIRVTASTLILWFIARRCLSSKPGRP